MHAGLTGTEGLSPEALLGNSTNKEVLDTAGLWKQSYWYRLKQRMQPPLMESEGPSPTISCTACLLS